MIIDALKGYYVAYWELFKATWWVGLVILVVYLIAVFWQIRKGR